MKLFDRSLQMTHLLKEHQSRSVANLTFSDFTFEANDTKEETHETKYWVKYVLTVVFIAVIVFTTFGNLTTIIAVRFDKHLKSISNLYIASLALADLIVGSIVMTFMLIYTVVLDGAWTLGPLLCDFWTFIDYVACSASLTNVCVIAGDRYLAISRPLKAITKRTKRRALLMVAYAWAFPASFWTAMIVFLRVSNARPPNGKCYLLWNPPFLALVAASITVYILIIVILILFVSIMVVLKKNMIAMEYKMRRSQSVKNTKRSNMKRCTRRRFTSAEAGGISFNPRFLTSKSDDEKDTDDTMSTCEIGKQCMSSDASDVDTSEESEAYYSVSIQQEKERLGRPFYRRGRLYRSVSTSTSPERYGLVRTIGTNTSSMGDHLSNTSLPDIAKSALIVTEVEVHVPVQKQVEETENTTESEHDNIIESVCERETRESVSGTPERKRDYSDSDSTSKTISSRGSLTRLHSKQTLDSDSDIDILGPIKRRRYASLLREKRHSHMERPRLKQQFSAAKTLGIIMTFLLLCWLPFAIMWPLRVFCGSCVSQLMYDISIWINYINSTINPIIYCLCNPNFKTAFKRILTRRIV